MTKAEIQEKHGIYRLEPPSELYRPLSKEESEQYENGILIVKKACEEFWDDDLT